MNVWFFSHYAEPPDGQWTATHDLAKYLVKRGHAITVFSSSVDHYTRKDTRLGRTSVSEVRYFDGVRFVLVKTLLYRRNDWRRLLNMMSYSVNSIAAGFRLKDRPDVIVGSS